ncbi:MAG: phosphatidate cytidylyltransferase, partial [Bacteroidota bacterium]
MSKFSNLLPRLVAAVIGAALIMTSLILGQWFYFGIFFFIHLFCLIEFYRMLAHHGYKPMLVLGTIAGSLLFVLSFLIESDLLSSEYYVLLFPIYSLVFLVKLYDKQDKAPFQSIAVFYLGLLYISVPFYFLNRLVFLTGEYSYQIIVGFLFLIWADDTGAYFSGSLFGKRKLFERISPKKSWEGLIGGAALSLLFAWALTHLFHDLQPWQWFIFGVLVVVAGTYGDLIESMLKRTMAIKDSGHSIPGHGGFLDRFDSLIYSVPFI